MERKPVLLLLVKNTITLVFIKKLLVDRFSLIPEKEEDTALLRMQNTLIDMVILEETFTSFERLKPFIRSIKTASSQSWLPFLLITDQWKKSFREEMIHVGITDFLSGTLNENEVQEKLTAAFQTKNLEEKIRTLSAKLPSFAEATLEQHFSYQLSTISKDKESSVDLLLVQIDQFENLEKTVSSLELQRIQLMITQFLYKKLNSKEKLNPLGKGRFLLLLSGKTKEEMTQLGKELQEEVKEIPFPSSKKPVFLSFSVVINHLDNPFDVKKAQTLFQKTLSANEKILLKKKKEQIIIP